MHFKNQRPFISNLIFFILTIVIFMACSTQRLQEHGSKNEMETFVDKNGQLRIEGTHIVNEHGEIVQLRGMSLFWSQWIGKYYKKETIDWLVEDWKINVIRAAIAVDAQGGYLEFPDREKSKIIEVIDAAIEAGIYVIVDWHSHHAEDHIETAIRFFDEISALYGDHPNILYETYNEPLDVSWNDILKPYHEEIIATIRKNDPDNIIVCGTRTWSQRVDEVVGNRIEDENVAYTLHYYAKTHDQNLRRTAQNAIDLGVPIFVTEFGTTRADGDGGVSIEDSELWWDFLEENKISWCNWSIADKEESSAALKPGTSPLGNWKEEELTTSGQLVRSKIRRLNSN